jgi:hypothetical protein
MEPWAECRGSGDAKEMDSPSMSRCVPVPATHSIPIVIAERPPRIPKWKKRERIGSLATTPILQLKKPKALEVG